MSVLDENDPRLDGDLDTLEHPGAVEKLSVPREPAAATILSISTT
jgi:hypothetical protein